jgi:uncharacterized protein YndB with AHSA1/START domain
MRQREDVNTPLTVTRDCSAAPEQVWAVIADGWTYSQWVVSNSRMRAACRLAGAGQQNPPHNRHLAAIHQR